MTDLKPCPFCGGEARRIDGGEFVTCSRSRKGCCVDEVFHIFYDHEWNTRPAPELPEGYREELTEDGHLIAPNGDTIARIREYDGRLSLGFAILGGSMAPEHFPALAIWLQRMSK